MPSIICSLSFPSVMPCPLLNDIAFALLFPIEIHEIKEEKVFHDHTSMLRMRTDLDVEQVLFFRKAHDEKKRKGSKMQ